jgi:hypothetical protein
MAAPKVSKKATNTIPMLSANGIPSSKPTPATNQTRPSAAYAQGIETSRAIQRIASIARFSLELMSDITISGIHSQLKQESDFNVVQSKGGQQADLNHAGRP